MILGTRLSLIQEKLVLFPQGKRHEHYSTGIVLSPEIGIGEIIDDRLGQWGVTKERVVQILAEKGTGEGPEEELYEVAFVRALISSVWDVDKMDYLLRDSMYCGVRYGLYDLDRILGTRSLYTTKILTAWSWVSIMEVSMQLKVHSCKILHVHSGVFPRCAQGL